jgi:hypothetical protein
MLSASGILGRRQAASDVLRGFFSQHNALSRPPCQSTLSQTARFWSARHPMSVCRLYIALVNAMDGRIAALGRGQRACMRAFAASPSDLVAAQPDGDGLLTFMHRVAWLSCCSPGDGADCCRGGFSLQVMRR